MRKSNVSLVVDQMNPPSAFVKGAIRTEAYFSESQPRLTKQPLLKRSEKLEVAPDPNETVANESPLRPHRMFQSVISSVLNEQDNRAKRANYLSIAVPEKALKFEEIQQSASKEQGVALEANTLAQLVRKSPLRHSFFKEVAGMTS